MSYFEAWDGRQRVAMWLMTGPTNTDADYEKNIATMLHLDTLGCLGSVLLADPENPPPSSLWRRRLSETAASLVHRRAFALVTPSLALRGALIALNWVFPSKGAATAVNTLDEAAALLGRHIGFVPVLDDLVHNVRVQAANAGLAPTPGATIAGDRRTGPRGRRRDDANDQR